MQRDRAGCKKQSGEKSQYGGGKVRADVQAKERMKIRSSKWLGTQAFFPALAMEEAAERLAKLR